MLQRAALLFLVFMTMQTHAEDSEVWCNPTSNTARVLDRPSPNSVHPDWRGESYIGKGWAFRPKEFVRADIGTFVKGDLFSTRGGLANADVYILLKEWDCSQWVP